jgi:sugar lactone lactonase YvrE
MRKITKIFILALALVMIFGTVSAFAVAPYDTYTYSIDGLPLQSPPAYDATQVLDSLGMKIGDVTPELPNLVSASDIVTDCDGNVYISDTGNNRIVVLNQYYQTTNVISSYEMNGKTYTFNKPQGLFVTNPTISETDAGKELYICDTNNNQVVVLDESYNFKRLITRPENNILAEEAFKPCAIAVDIYGRVFITSTACFEGVIVLSSEGDFTGFIGAQKVTYSVFEMIWRRFQTKEQRENSASKLAVPYNNITVDNEGFVYVTTSSTKEEHMNEQFGSITSKEATHSPVKKLNSAGDEIMKRNGFFDPGGEVDVDSKEVSQIIDVGVGPEKSWTILDQRRNRFFTYDQNGNLLFAFGDKGDSLGNGENFIGMTYQNVNGTYYLIALDNSTVGYKINVYTPTPYHQTIMNALYNQNAHNYSASITCWQDVLTLNNNFDLAYIGIGKALFQQGKYEEAQEMLSNAYEIDQYSKAFKELRQEFIQKNLLWIVIFAVALIYGIVKFLGYAKKKNKVTTLKVGRKTYWEELIYSFYLVFHPFDGFWDLKHEKRGSVRASLTFMGLTVIAFFYQAIGKGYTFNPRGDYSTIFMQLAAVAVPLILWCVSNWCLTTLFDGEGSFKDIVVATGYACAPLPLFVIISTILTNVMTVGEGQIVSLLVTVGYVWVGILLFFGMLVTHDYSINKNIATVLGTIVAMAIIMFVVILFSSLLAKMATFIGALISEIGNLA